MTRGEFRARWAALASRLAATDLGRVVARMVTWVQLQLDLERQVDDGHSDPHLAEDGSCWCDCDRCVGTWFTIDIPPSQLVVDQLAEWGLPPFSRRVRLWRRLCICESCEQECPKIGRLEREGPWGDDAVPGEDAVPGSAGAGGGAAVELVDDLGGDAVGDESGEAGG